MDAIPALRRFAKGALRPDKARRYIALLETKNGLQKIVYDLAHVLESEIDPRLITSQSKMPMTSPCFVFHGSRDLGTPHETMMEAYESLAGEDCWLIVAQDGLAEIHRPEGRWDAEKMIRIK